MLHCYIYSTINKSSMSMSMSYIKSFRETIAIRAKCGGPIVRIKLIVF